MDEAQIKAVMEKIKAAYWNRRLIDEDLIRAVRSPEMMKLLFNQLGNEDLPFHSDAGFALSEIAGEIAKDGLVNALSSEKWQVRAAAAEALGNYYHDFQLTQYLIPMLNDPAQKVRMAVAESLEGLRDPSAVPSLIEAIKDVNRHIYTYAVYALYDIAAEYELPELYPYLKSDDIRMRTAAAYVLGAKGGKDAVQGLIDLVRVGMSGDKTEFEHAQEHLLLIEEPPIEDLIAVLDERDAMLSQLVMPVLVKAKDKRAIPHIVAAMGDEDFQVYEAATWGASQFGEAAIPSLLEALKDENVRLRINAVEALGIIGDVKISADLVGLLGDPDAEVRRTVLDALAKIGAIDAVEHIIPLLKGAAQDANKQWTTAHYAAQVLKQNLTTPEGLEAVERWRREQR